MLRDSRRRGGHPGEGVASQDATAQTLNHPQVLDLKRTPRVKPAPETPPPPAVQPLQYRPYAAIFRNGETRTRTGDTTIFSRVLYQLSYLAWSARC